METVNITEKVERETAIKFFQNMKSKLGIDIKEAKAVLKLAGYSSFKMTELADYELTLSRHFYAKKRKKLDLEAKMQPCLVPGCPGYKIASANPFVRWTCTEYGTMHYWFIYIGAYRASLETSDKIEREKLTLQYAKEWYDRQLKNIAEHQGKPQLGDTVEV